ncbi:MAG: NAD(+) synthase [bacterium]|nr:NAD(+) synthase [bacterium]
MKQEFVRVAVATPKIQVADPEYNGQQIVGMIEEAWKHKAKVLVFPELCLTGYTCGDLFLQETLLKQAKQELKKLAEQTKGKDILVFVGLPWEWNQKLYNVAAAVCDGEVLALVPKSNIPNYAEFYEARHFKSANAEPVLVPWLDGEVWMGSNILFSCRNLPNLRVAAEICEDVWVMAPPSIRHAQAGATMIVNGSASSETTGKASYRRNLILGQSARLVAAYLYANAGEGESSQDLVFGGQNMIAENGSCLAESERFHTGITYADVDLGRIAHDRRQMNTCSTEEGNYILVEFELQEEELDLQHRFVDAAPFVPKKREERELRCDEILSIQAMGLKKRLEHVGCENAVLGISGGLDSTLALLVTARAYDLLGISRDKITAVTMPCFGTTDRTYRNACLLTKTLGATLREVDIKKAVQLHFEDIGQDAECHDITYENAQARERTQVLMDLANQKNGLVIGTGDMSELALGWATYNGDHMSMYGVNAGVPKTLVRHLVRYYAEQSEEETLKKVLFDVLDTPVSPELLPPKDGEIAQKTEDLVGPYELHDFYLYYVLRFGYEPEKIYRLAQKAFEGEYEKKTILKWLKVFYRRFFSQQFKRSCLPDGPKVGTVGISPRGDLRMPSDASAALWLRKLEELAE